MLKLKSLESGTNNIFSYCTTVLVPNCINQTVISHKFEVSRILQLNSIDTFLIVSRLGRSSIYHRIFETQSITMHTLH